MFNRKKKRIKELEATVEDLSKKVELQEEQRKKLTNLYAESDLTIKKTKIELAKVNQSLDNSIEKLKKIEEEKKSYSCRIGGLTKEINKLREDLKISNNDKNELEIKLKESMTGKYLVKKLSPGRTPNMNKTKLAPPISTRVTKFMKENYD